MTVPVEPPPEYLPEIVEYLHLEYGESAEDPDALKASDLTHVGLFSIDGLPTYYWSYPGSKGSVHYATCEVYANSYCLGMTSDAPPEDGRIRRSEDCPQLRTLDLPPERSVPWYRRGLLGGIFNTLTMGRVMAGTLKHINDTRTESENLSHLPMAELLPRYIDAMALDANDSRGAARPAPGPTKIAETQARLGVELPDSVVDFYRLSDGLDWHNPMRNAPLPPLAELRWGRDFDPPMSKRFRSAWEEGARDGGESEALQVTGDDIAGMLGHNAEEISFAATDDMIALSRPDGANVLLLTMSDLAGMPKHSVIEAEGIYCTKFGDLGRWMSAQAAMFGGLKRMQDKYAGKFK